MNDQVETIPDDSGSQEAAPVGFLDSLPEELRHEPSLKNFTDVGQLAKSHVHAQRMVGADKIALPGSGSNDDDWMPIFQKLGAPNNADGYQLQNVELDEVTLQSFKEMAASSGMLPRHAQAAAEFLQTQSAAGGEAAQANMDAVSQQYDAELREEFGMAYDAKHERAAAAGKAMGIDPAIWHEIRLDNGLPLGDHPFIIKLFSGLADQLGEDTLEGATTEMVMTPEEAGRKVAELTAPGTPYWDKNHPAHDQDVAEVLRLRGYQFPEQQEG